MSHDGDIHEKERKIIKGIVALEHWRHRMRSRGTYAQMTTTASKSMNGEKLTVSYRSTCWGVDHTGRFWHHPSASSIDDVKKWWANIYLWTQSPTISELEPDGKFGVIRAWVFWDMTSSNSRLLEKSPIHFEDCIEYAPPQWRKTEKCQHANYTNYDT